MSWSHLDQDGAIMLIGSVRRKQFELIHPFVVPFDRSERPVDFKSVFASWSFHNAADFENPLCSACKLNKRPDVVFVADRCAGSVTIDGKMRPLSRSRNRA